MPILPPDLLSRILRPPMLDSGSVPRLLCSLEAATRAHPFERKLLVCRRPAEGRELLRALAAAGVAWVGWEAVTVRGIALEAAEPLPGVSLADEFDEMAAADRAIDRLEAGGGAGALAEGPGARDAVRAALSALRRGGVDAAALRAARPDDARLEALAQVVDGYADALRGAGREDEAMLLARALDALESGAAELSEGRVHLLPGLPLRGGAGRLVRLLVERGGVVLETDPVLGMDPPRGVLWAAGGAASPLAALHLDPPSPVAPPDVELFAAATPADELREVLRRVAAEGPGWDGVEVVAADAEVYGAALDSLARLLEAVDGAGVPTTYAEGLDVRRTRAGRALEAYFRWISEGFPADVLRGMLEAGELAADGGVSGAALARRLRRLRVGWGHERYLAAIGRALRTLAYSPEELVVLGDDGPAASARERGELEALRALLEPILAATPAGPDRAGTRAARTSPAALAAGALAFLERVPRGGAADGVARAALEGRLRRAAETLTRETSWEGAVSVLRARLDTRIAPGGEEGTAPWTAAGGRLHLSALASGGLASRGRVFVVGLDASAGAAKGGADPLLSDADRILLGRLSPDPVPPLATSADRAAEARHALAGLLARLRGRVTLSYAAWDAAEGRAASPAPELLQALRHREGRAEADYAALREAMGPLASAVPREGRLLDGRDAWLAALAAGGTMREGRAAVRDAFRGLDAGVRASEARAGDAAGEFHGVVAARPGGRRAEVFSASMLEALGVCPRRYFYRYVLGVSPADDPEWDPEAWLTPAERGSLLHRVYERTLREARQGGEEASSPAFEARGLAVLEAEAARAAERAQPPAESVRRAELRELRRDLGCWVEMIREAPPEWRELELRFGPGEREVSVGGSLVLRGVIDRVDSAGGERVRVVDYKTGKPDRYHPLKPLDGGRRVQHLVYARAAAVLTGAEVDAVEFHFPTSAGRNERVSLPLPAAEEAEGLLARMAALAAEGPYLATDDAGDCAFCDFCAVCRAVPGDFGGAASPPAAWMKAVGMQLEEAEALRMLRGLDG